MRVARITVKDFIGVPTATVSTDRPLTVVTGANGSGKTTLPEALRLVRAAISGNTRDVITTLDRGWGTAGRFGAGSFEVRVKIKFGEPEECALVDAFYRAATLGLCHPEVADVPALVRAIDSRLPDDASLPLTVGELVVLHDARRRSRWTVGWQFETQRGPAHVQLLGDGMPSLVDGPVSTATNHVRYSSELLPFDQQRG